MRPSKLEPLAWYDRVIRIVGGLMIFGVLVGGFVLVLADMLRK